MQTRTKNLGKLVRLATIMIAFLTISLSASAYYSHNRYSARQVINKTAYIIDEAYQVANYYNYWSGEYISRAIHYNDYAERQYSRRNYRNAIYFSLKAREYALMVIDGCDEYWDYYYYENYGWSRTYGYNPYYNGNHGNHHYGNYDNYYNNNYNNYHNNHGNNPNYNSNRPNNYNDGRGTNGRTDAFDPNKPNNNGTSTGRISNGGTYKNIGTENYFDKDERDMLKQLPDDNSMENQFKMDNKDVRFDNNAVKNNPTLINQNRTKADAFKKNTTESSRKAIKIAEPKRINEINANKTNDLKPINNNRTIETKPIKTNNTDFRNIESNKTNRKINTNKSNENTINTDKTRDNNRTINQEKGNRNINLNNNPRRTRETKIINPERRPENKTNIERKTNNKTEIIKEKEVKGNKTSRTR